MGHGLKRAERQRRALAGDLVPQNPADEPASALLARIRAERGARDGQTGRREDGKRGRRRAAVQAALPLPVGANEEA